MELEALKVIWDSQNNEPLYAVNEKALHALVRRRNLDFARRAAWWQFREIAVGAVFGMGMLGLAGLLALSDPAWLVTIPWIRVAVTPWDIAALVLAAGIWFYYAAYMFNARRLQLRREENFASSLRGDLERALDHVDFQIRIARSIVWWGFVPAWIAMVLWMIVAMHLKDVRAGGYILLAGALGGALAIGVVFQYRMITRRFEPRRSELVTLRAKLVEPKEPS